VLATQISLPPWWAVAALACAAAAGCSVLRRFGWRRLLLCSAALHIGLAGLLFDAVRRPPTPPKTAGAPKVPRTSGAVVRRTSPPAKGPASRPTSPTGKAEVSTFGRLNLPNLTGGPPKAPTVALPPAQGVGTDPGFGSEVPPPSPRVLAAPDVVVRLPPPPGRIPGPPGGPPVVGVPGVVVPSGGPGGDSPFELASLPVARPQHGGIFQLQGAGGRLVFIVDMSGSMLAHGKNVATLRDLVAEIDRCPPETELEVIFFSSRFVALNGGETPKLARKSDEMVARLKRLVEFNERWLAERTTPGGGRPIPRGSNMTDADTVVPGGGTQPQAALIAALGLEVDEIHLLTDGIIAPRELELDEVKAHHKDKTKIYAIEIGPEPEPTEAEQKERLIYKLAEQHGGPATERGGRAIYRYVPVAAAPPGSPKPLAPTQPGGMP
jgi:hypothetical protein